MSDFKKLINFGAAAMSSGNLQGAVSFFKRAFEATDDFSQQSKAGKLLGKCYEELGGRENLERALVQYERAAGLAGYSDPSDTVEVLKIAKLAKECRQKLDEQ